MRSKKLDSLVLAEIAIAIALATVLSFIKILSMPYGGSVTLGSMVPILLLAFRRARIYGFVQLFLDGWFYSPIGMFLDYPLAFGVLGIAGLFKKLPEVVVIIALVCRLICHFISGVVFFGIYAPERMSPIIYSAIYNSGYMLLEMFISCILIYLLIQRGILNTNI